MGRGNVCVRGKCEGLYYIDRDRFEAFELDENEEPKLDSCGYKIHDYDLEQMQLDDDLNEFTNMFTSKYKSFKECDEWIDNGTKAILESELFYIAVEDNEWSMAIVLLQKEQSPYHDYNFEGLQAGLYQKYLNGMRDCLFNLYTELGVYGGAWTSGRIERPEDFKFMSA